MTASEPPATQPRCLVVGYDGSASAIEALEFAREHAREGTRLVVVHAYEPLPPGHGAREPDMALYERLTDGRALLRRAAAALAGSEHELELLEGPPAAAIRRVAGVRDADAIVVGSRGFGRLRAALGSVSHELLHVADRPVIVVPARSRLHSGALPPHASRARIDPTDAAGASRPPATEREDRNVGVA